MKKACFLLCIWCTFSTQVKAVELISTQQKLDAKNLIFTPQFDLQISQKVIDAIDNGIVITFVYQAKLFESIQWWFDTVIESKIQTFEVRYFSLGSQYQLHHTNSKNKFSFVTLEELLEHMSQQTSFKFKTNQHADYFETRIFLDKQALPSIMQLPNVFDADWNLNSDWQNIAITPLDKTQR